MCSFAPEIKNKDNKCVQLCPGPEIKNKDNKCAVVPLMILEYKIPPGPSFKDLKQWKEINMAMKYIVMLV